MDMLITIHAPKYREPVKRDMLVNIDALNRAIQAAPPSDVTALEDTLSILEGIYQKLPD